MSDVAIKIEGISKKYSVGKEKDGSLRGTINGLFKKKTSISEDFWALKDVSFEVKKGEVIGIIGKNGAGKSTLLKILSQITKPNEGSIEINGRVASLLEVGTGFHPELTGRENIFLNGTILGMSRKEVKQKFDEIVEFSGVEKFINTPVKHYSSGMYVRLAFAVAAHLEPEILIIDEVLAVGDAEFQKKCLGKMRNVANQGRTVLFVSHNISAIQSLCNKGAYINKGKLIKYGSIDNIIKEYTSQSSSEMHFERINNSKLYISKAEIRFDDISFQNFIYINLEIKSETNTTSSIDFRFKNHMDTPVGFASIGSLDRGNMYNIIKGLNHVELKIKISNLALGHYLLGIDLTEPEIEYYDRVDLLSFEINRSSTDPNTRILNSRWNLGNFELPIISKT